MELLDSKVVYEGSAADVAIKRYRRAGGAEVERQVIEHPGSVAILAHDEEVGLAAASWSELKALYTSPGFVSERATIFEATGLSAVDSNPDEDEEIEVVRWPLADLDGLIDAVEDATTLVALLIFRQRRANA